MTARILALLIGVLGLASLRAQYDALLPPVSGQSLPWQVWFLAGYFTILTNFAATFHMLAAARGWRIGASRAAGLVLSMVMVALVYHAVLARLWAPEGQAWWADQGLHTAMPLAMVLWWLGFAPKDVTARDLPWWLIWPAAYCAYALIRGQISGIYPYPFLDVAAQGWPAVGLNTAGLLAAFAGLGLGLIWLARRLPGRRGAAP
jgi:hypothetical protein